MRYQILLQQFTGLFLLGLGLVGCGSTATPEARPATPTALTIVSSEWNLTNPITLFKANGSILSLAFSPDGQALAVATSNGIAAIQGQEGQSKAGIALLHLPDGQIEQIFSGHTNQVRSVAFSPDGQTLASGSKDKTIKLWRVADGQQVASFQAPTTQKDGLLNLAFSPDGQMVAATTADTAWVWRIAESQPFLTLPTGNRWAEISFSPDGQMLATRSSENEIALWRLDDGQQAMTLADSAGLCGPLFSPDGQLIASCQRDSTIHLLSVQDGQVKLSLDGHAQRTDKLAFSPDGQLLASAGIDSSLPEAAAEIPSSALRLWRIQDGQLVAKGLEISGIGRALAFSPDGKWLASGLDNIVYLWQIQ